MSDFPTLVYKSPGDHFGPGSSTYSYKGVGDARQLGDALSAGWFRTLSEALSGDHEEPEDGSAPTREEMEEKATELGIKFDGRTTDAGLLKKIEAATAEGA